MMKRKICLFVLLSLLICGMAFPQGKELRALDTGRFNVHAEGGMLIGNPDGEDSAPFVFHSYMNYTFVRNLSFGIGTGVEFMRETHLPVMFNAMYRFRSKNVAPFTSFQAGYLLPLESRKYYHIAYYDNYSYPNPGELKAKGGLMANYSIGIIIRLTDDLGMTIAAGYRHHRLKYSANVEDDHYALDLVRTTDYNRFSLTVGLLF
jgi:hypothetical protein